MLFLYVIVSSAIMFQRRCFFSSLLEGMGGPRSSSSTWASFYFSRISLMISGRLCLMCVKRSLVSLLVRVPQPRKPGGIVEYTGCVLKNRFSLSMASFTEIWLIISS